MVKKIRKKIKYTHNTGIQTGAEKYAKRPSQEILIAPEQIEVNEAVKQTNKQVDQVSQLTDHKNIGDSLKNLLQAFESRYNEWFFTPQKKEESNLDLSKLDVDGNLPKEVHLLNKTLDKLNISFHEALQKDGARSDKLPNILHSITDISNQFINISKQYSNNPALINALLGILRNQISTNIHLNRPCEDYIFKRIQNLENSPITFNSILVRTIDGILKNTNSLLLKNPNFVLSAIPYSCSTIFFYMDEELKKDKEFILEAIKKSHITLIYESPLKQAILPSGTPCHDLITPLLNKFFDDLGNNYALYKNLQQEDQTNSDINSLTQLKFQLLNRFKVFWSRELEEIANIIINFSIDCNYKLDDNSNDIKYQYQKDIQKDLYQILAFYLREDVLNNEIETITVQGTKTNTIAFRNIMMDLSRIMTTLNPALLNDPDILKTIEEVSTNIES